MSKAVSLSVIYRRTSQDWITASCPVLNLSALGSTEEKALDNLKKAVEEKIDFDPGALAHRVEVKTATLIVENGQTRWR